MGAFNQLNGAIFDAGAIEARISAIDGKSVYNQRDGGILDFDSLARRLTALDGKIAVGQGGIQFDVDSFMRRLAAIEAGVWSPLLLFAAGEQGFWYDYSDFTTLFQDSAGTTPVTAVGQPVGKVLDKSGRGNHKIQATTTSRPTVQQDASGCFYLNLDGVDDCLATGAINLSATSKATVFAGVRKGSDAGYAVVAECFTGDSKFATWLAAPRTATDYGASIRDAAAGAADVQIGSFASPDLAVITSALDYTAAGALNQVQIRRNGVAVGGTANTNTLTNTTFGSYTAVHIGARNGLSSFLTGRIYSLIVRGASSTAAEVASAEKYVGSRTGIAL